MYTSYRLYSSLSSICWLVLLFYLFLLGFFKKYPSKFPLLLLPFLPYTFPPHPPLILIEGKEHCFVEGLAAMELK